MTENVLSLNGTELAEIIESYDQQIEASGSPQDKLLLKVKLMTLLFDARKPLVVALRIADIKEAPWSNGETPPL